MTGHSLELTVQAIKDAVAQIGSEFSKPDDDWINVLIMECDHGQGMIPMEYDSERDKNFYAYQVIPTAIRMFRPWLVAEVQSAWSVLLDHPPEQDTPPPSEHPDRVEIVIMLVFTADQIQAWSTPINRHPDRPPTLGDWKLDSPDHWEGRFVTPIIEAMKEVNP